MPRSDLLARASCALPLLLVVACSGGNGSGNGSADAGPDLAQFSDPKPPPLPAGFLFGAATAPFAIEGQNHYTDLFQWESTAANATMARSDDGPRSFVHFEEDAAAAAAMHHNAMRLGIDMARLFPLFDNFPGRPDAAAVKHYHDVFASLKAKGIRPMVTLWNGAWPQWLQDLDHLTDVSGWQGGGIAQTFAAFAAWAGREYGGEVDLWCPLDGPMASLLAGYVQGTLPPLFQTTDAKGVARMLVAYRNMVRAHARAFDALHTADTIDADADGKPALVGIAALNRVFSGYPADDPKVQADNDAAAKQIEYLWNVAFLNALTSGDLDGDLDGNLDAMVDKKADPDLKGRLDWIGESYYGVTFVKSLGAQPLGPLAGVPVRANVPTARPKTELGWDIHAEGLRQVLGQLKPYKLPVYVTGNGLADGADAQRPRFLLEHLYAVQKAVADGVDVRGYFHGSLIDGLEGPAGYCPRFGLYAVDYNDPARKRTARPSADLYRQLIDARDVDPALLDKYPSYPAPAMTCKGG